MLLHAAVMKILNQYSTKFSDQPGESLIVQKHPAI
jgi:hypothetical protein